MQKETTQPTIDEMNEVIARFMGASSIKEHGGKRYAYYPHSCARDVTDLQYHSSWDWLMPVVKKIYDTNAAAWKKRPPHTAVEDDLIEVDIHCAVREVDILKAHGFVYQFITWYNQNKTNEQ